MLLLRLVAFMMCSHITLSQTGISYKLTDHGYGRVDVIHLIQLILHLENSVLCRLFCVFLNGSNLYDDCRLAVLYDKAVKDVFNSFSSSVH